MRAGHRASTTRLIGQARTALSADPLKFADLELLIGNFKKKLEALSPLDQEILELTDDGAIDEETDCTDQYHENVQRVMADLNRALLSVSALTPRTSTTTDSSERKRAALYSHGNKVNNLLQVH